MASVGEPLDLALARIAAGRIPPILVTRFDPERGEDLFGRDRLLQNLGRAVLQDAPAVFGQTVLDAPVVTLAEILDAAREVSLLARRRLVLVRGSRLAGSDAEEETAEAGPDVRESAERTSGAGRSERGGDAAQIAVLERYLKESASSACIIFVGCPWDG